jgi:quercetin dioxygenase-like cupin family protein
MKTALRIAARSFVGLALFTAGLALGQQTGPTDYRGVDEEVLAAIDLAKEIGTVENRDLRVSRAIVAPGGHIGLHSHKGDPTIVYVLQGTLTNHHDDGTTQEYQAGQAFAEFGLRPHWVKNSGATPLIFIAANIHHRE